MKKMLSVLAMVMLLLVSTIPVSTEELYPADYKPVEVKLNVKNKVLNRVKYTDVIMSKLGMPQAELLKFLETNTEIAFLEIEYDKKTYRCLNTMKEFVGWVYFDNGIMTAAYVFEEYSDQPASKTTGYTDLRYLQQKWADARITIINFKGAKHENHVWDEGVSDYIIYPNKYGNVFEVNFINTYDKAEDLEYACLSVTGYLNQAAFKAVPKGR